MMRILGIVCGAAIAVALLTWFIGVPQFTSQRYADDADPIAVVALPPPGPRAERSPPVDVPAPPDAMPAAAAPAAPVPAAADTPPPPAEEPEAVAALPAEVTVAETPPAALPPDQWYAFWSPFRSEIAANGFVAELQRVTGLDYRVVKVKPGVYEVAFSYADEDSLEQYLSTISAATGLELPGSP